MSTDDLDCEGLPSFKRNHYFYGKLLSVEDFQIEQQYFVNKYRLINRLVHGTGIVSGLEVTKGIPIGTIEVSEGFALDGRGREVVLNTKFKCDLNQKYTPNDVGRERDLFVTIRYEETKVDPIPAPGETKTEFNMILEGAKIEVDWVPPDPSSTDTIFLAKISTKTRRKKICIEKIEDSAVVRGRTLTRVVIGKRKLA
jgi:hypothetical protein